MGKNKLADRQDVRDLAGRSDPIDKGNYVARAQACIRARVGQMGVTIDAEKTPRQWRAWLAYFSRLGIATSAMQTIGHAATPTDWPAEFDLDAGPLPGDPPETIPYLPFSQEQRQRIAGMLRELAQGLEFRPALPKSRAEQLADLAARDIRQAHSPEERQAIAAAQEKRLAELKAAYAAAPVAPPQPVAPPEPRAAPPRPSGPDAGAAVP
jgi:hypothetical protein